jgi:hypothetical protein
MDGAPAPPTGATRVFQWKVKDVMSIQAEADALQQRIRQLGGERTGNWKVSCSLAKRKKCEWAGGFKRQTLHTVRMSVRVAHSFDTSVVSYFTASQAYPTKAYMLVLNEAAEGIKIISKYV